MMQVDASVQPAFKVLIIDESALERVSLSRMCAKMGYQTHECDNAAVALEIVERERIDLVLCDWEFADTTGLDICTALRNAKFDFFIYFILISRFSDERYILSALMAGTDEFIHKPINRSELEVRLLVAQRVIKLQRKLFTLRNEVPRALRDLQRDLRAMSGLQASLLPDRRQKYPGLRFDYFWIPKVFVSGDHLNLVRLDEQWTAFYVLDVVGHGVPAALRALALSRVLSTHPQEGILVEHSRERYSQRVRGPAEVLEILNQRYQMQGDTEVYFCLVYGLFNAFTGEVTFATAGSPYPIVQTAQGALYTVGGSSFPVGIVEEPGYSDVSIHLRADMRLFFFTDGITEIRDMEGQQLGFNGLMGLLADNTSVTLKSQLENVRQGLAHWASGKPGDQVYEDDATLLALQWRSHEESVRISESYSPRSENIKPAQPVDAWSALGDGFQFARRKENSRVLVWTDQAAMDWLLGNLTDWGYHVELHHTMNDVKERLVAEYFTFLLVDLQNLPEDLPDFIRMARREGANRSLFVLMLTSESNQDRMMFALQAGADNCTMVNCSAREIYVRLANGLRIADNHRRMLNKNETLKTLRQEIEEDMKRIAHMQLSNLPSPQIGYGKLKYDWVFHSGSVVSREYMNVFDLGENQVGFFHLTANGNGLVGATRGWAVYRQLSGAAYEHRGTAGRGGSLFKPSEMLRELNTVVLEERIGDLEFKLVYGVMNALTGEGKLALAGYPLSAIARARGAHEYVGAFGPAIGLNIESSFQDVTFHMNEGDRLLLISPSFFENTAVELVEDRFAPVSNGGAQTLAEWLAGLKLTLNLKDQKDDVSLLVLEYGNHRPVKRFDVARSALEGWTQQCERLLPAFIQHFDAGVEFEVPLLQSAISDLTVLVEHMLLELGMAESLRHAATLSLFEVCTNITRHSLSNPETPFYVRVFACRDGDFVVLVQDDGQVALPSDKLELAQSFDFDFDTEDADALPEGGLGLAIVHQLSRCFVSQRIDGKNWTAMLFGESPD
ncbi:MAG TPA: SpoIIE family protein phosphatase [Limnobacter sp.]|nr:SpoIIE family protein phosphatase [Limnobacter sp.]